MSDKKPVKPSTYPKGLADSAQVAHNYSQISKTMLNFAAVQPLLRRCLVKIADLVFYLHPLLDMVCTRHISSSRNGTNLIFAGMAEWTSRRSVVGGAVAVLQHAKHHICARRYKHLLVLLQYITVIKRWKSLQLQEEKSGSCLPSTCFLCAFKLTNAQRIVQIWLAMTSSLFYFCVRVCFCSVLQAMGLEATVFQSLHAKGIDF